MKHTDPYRTAKELGITDDERDGLIQLTQIFPYTTEPFDMWDWHTCMYGWLCKLGYYRFSKEHSDSLVPLFIRRSRAPCWQNTRVGYDINATAVDAARAIVYFLTFGE